MTNEDFQKLVLEQLGQINKRLDNVEATQLRAENQLSTTLGALKDGFELRGDQIERLQDHLDNRLDEIQTDLSYVVTKVAQHDRNFVQIRTGKKRVKP